jgi:hypothetical protein
MNAPAEIMLLAALLLLINVLREFMSFCVIMTELSYAKLKMPDTQNLLKLQLL